MTVNLLSLIYISFEQSRNGKLGARYMRTFLIPIGHQYYSSY
jgi:hypothetical protein